MLLFLWFCLGSDQTCSGSQQAGQRGGGGEMGWWKLSSPLVVPPVISDTEQVLGTELTQELAAAAS